MWKPMTLQTKKKNQFNGTVGPRQHERMQRKRPGSKVQVEMGLGVGQGDGRSRLARTKNTWRSLVKP